MFELLILFMMGPVARAGEFNWSFDQYIYGQSIQLDDSVANPQNAVIELPGYSLLDDLRPEFKYQTEQTKWLLRPRWILEQDWISVSGENVSRATGKFDVSDAYVDWRMNDAAHATAGLEVFQWGPAEMFNASNPLYHFNLANRSVYFKEKGQALVRLSLDASDRWNHMLILNPVSNNEPNWLWDQNFHAGGFLKSEYRSERNDFYFAGLAGTQPDGRYFFGEYFDYTLVSGWSIYADGRHPLGHRDYIPVLEASGTPTMVSRDDNTSVQSLVLAGLRYEGRADWRVEYFYNSEGYDHQDFTLGLHSLQVQGPQSLVNFPRFLRPGLELYGQHYAYFSVRVPDLGRKRDWQVALRGLLSLQDGSSVWRGSVEKPLSDSVVLDVEGSLMMGEGNQELTLVERSLWLAGIKWTL